MRRSPRLLPFPRLARRFITWAAFATVTAQGSGPASAHPDVRALAGGTCPSQPVLEAAIDRRIKTPIGAPFTLRVQSARGRASMTLTDGAGEVRVERTVESEDCSALADAVSLIVEAFFIEIGIVPGVAPPPAPTVAPPPAPTVAPPAPSVAPPPAPSVAPPLAPPPPPSTVDPGQTQARSLDVLAMGGLELLAGSGVASAAFAAGLETEWPAARSPLRVEIVGTTPTVQAIPDRVQRWAARSTLTWGVRLGTSPSFEPWLGGGLSRAVVRAPDLDRAPTTTCWSAVVTAGVRARQRIGSAWYLLADAGCYLLGSQEAYRITPDGELGRGPRWGCDLTLGGSWAFVTFK